ncbi:MAG: sel1 repeat family protein [Proteobacteria bacterium]|nr:sel1 repeat family protein [Pseudomonadota bacterium]
MRTVTTFFLTMIPLMLASISWSADFAKGQSAYDSGDYETALTEWQLLAEEGDANGQFGLGLLHDNGFGVPLDSLQAAEWYQSAAEQGHGAAQCNLAVMYENGWGVAQSDEDAFKWYSLAAEQGIVPAQYSLGKMYKSGFGVARDNVMAYMWLTIAFEMGNNSARFKRDTLVSKMSVEDIARSDDLAREWLDSYQNLQAQY